MEQNSQYNEEMDLDITQYIKVFIKRKKTFILMVLFALIIGIAYIMSSPKMYRITMMIQPPVSGKSLTGASDIENAENLRGLIINGAFNEEIQSRLNLDRNSKLQFNVFIPSKTNLLQLSVDLDAKTKESGKVLLQNLCEIISDKYSKVISSMINGLDMEIKGKEYAIINVKERAKNLQDQIKEITFREEKLTEEVKVINKNTTQILVKREDLLKKTSESVSVLLLTNFLQNNLSYLNQMNNQFSELSIRRANLYLEIKNIDSQINDFQMGINKLKEDKDFIANLKILAQPRVSSSPVSPNKKKVLAFALIMGMFFGMLIVFIQEFMSNQYKKV